MRTKMRFTNRSNALLTLGLSLAAPNCSPTRATAPPAATPNPNPAETAVAAIQRLGGSFEVDDTRGDRPVVKVDLHATQVTNDDLALLGALPDLRELDLRKTHISDVGLAHLKDLHALRSVNLFRTTVGDAGLKYLSGNKELEVLLIGGTRVTDEGLAEIKAFSHLRKLSVFDTAVGDAGLKHLVGLSALEVLITGKSKVTGAGTAEIQRALPKVRFDEPT